MHKKIITICLFLGVFANAFAQGAKWSLGLAFSPDACYRTISGDKSNPNTATLMQFRETNDHIKLGYSAGLLVKRRCNEIVSLETGLLYSNRGFAMQMQARMTDQNHPDGIGDPVTISQLFHFKYVDIPLKINFTAVRFGKMDMHFSTGAQLNIFMEQKTVTYVISDNQDAPKSVYYAPKSANDPVNVSVLFGMGITRQLGEKTQLQIEPIMRYNIMPLFQSQHMETRLWTLGVNTVLYCEL
jgi:hypothetical protein